MNDLTQNLKTLKSNNLKNWKIVQKLSAEPKITTKQFENLINSKRYYHVINDTLEERAADHKCKLILCGNKNRLLDTNLKAKFAINTNKNKVHGNEERRKYCGEICHNLWTILDKEIREIKPDMVLEDQMRLEKGDLVDRSNFRKKIRVRDLKGFCQLIEAESKSSSTSYQNSNKLTELKNDEVKIHDRLTIDDIAPDLGALNLNSRDQLSCPVNPKKPTLEQKQPKNLEKPSNLQEFIKLYRSWLTLPKLQLEPKRVDLQEILFSDMRQIPDDASIASSDNESLADESDLSLWVGNLFFYFFSTSIYS